ncbi:hypothetical protein LINPERPRIM_LOCUS20837, partial [Linum perenne]
PNWPNIPPFFTCSKKRASTPSFCRPSNGRGLAVTQRDPTKESASCTAPSRIMILHYHPLI